MGYTVLARRYRSRDFEEVVGQEPIARTLTNAVASGRIAHAYLFCGTRGVGKTTMARLLARELNVTDELVEGEAISDAIMRGEDLDVIEIDGASNRGVQEARDLIASAGLKPSRCPYRIYIIDEVHMLTRDAFNALLKTMEEPPEHVKFILCTTEPNDVLQTIQSRCQRFDFRAIPDHLITEHLQRILAEEGVAADEDALARVSRLGAGSMRDALSILDRLLAADPDRITKELIEEMLGLPAQSRIESMLDAALAGDAGTALAIGQDLLQQGITIEQALDSLTESLRTMLIGITCGVDSDMLPLNDEARSALRTRLEGVDAAGVLHMIARCEATARHARFTASSRALFDALLVRLSTSEHLASIPALLRGDTAASSKKKGRRTGVESSPQSTRSAVEAPQPTRTAPPRAGSKPSPPQRSPKPPAPKQEKAAPEVQPVTAEGIWTQVLRDATSSSALATVDGLRAVAYRDGVLKLDREDSGRGAISPTRRDALGRLVERVLGRSVQIEVGGKQETGGDRKTVEPMENQPDVRAVLREFDAVVVEVEDPNPTSSSKENQ